MEKKLLKLMVVLFLTTIISVKSNAGIVASSGIVGESKERVGYFEINNRNGVTTFADKSKSFFGLKSVVGFTFDDIFGGNLFVGAVYKKGVEINHNKNIINNRNINNTDNSIFTKAFSTAYRFGTKVFMLIGIKTTINYIMDYLQMGNAIVE